MGFKRTANREWRNAMKLFLKIFGAILFVFGIILAVSIGLAVFAVSIYIILQPWMVLPLESSLGFDRDLDLGQKIGITVVGVIFLFIILLLTYCHLDTLVDRKSRYAALPSQPITPTPLQAAKKSSKPILGDNTLNRLSQKE